MEKHSSGIKLESWRVSAGRVAEPGALLNVPLIPASNFIIGRGREYARDDGTATWEAFEAVVGGLETGQAVACASGMAAIAAVFDQLATGAVVVLPDDCYQAVAGLAAAGAQKRALVGAARRGGRCHRHCSDSAWVSRTPTIAGLPSHSYCSAPLPNWSYCQNGQ